MPSSPPYCPPRATLWTSLASALAGHPRHARMARAWQTLLALMLSGVLVLALMPAPPQDVDLGWDKLNHFGAFAVLAVVAALALVRPRWQLAAGLLAYGGLIEVLQSFTATRSGEWADLLADAVGISIGLALVALAARWVRSRA